MPIDIGGSVEGETTKEIGRDLKVSRNSERKELRSGDAQFEFERGFQPRRKLGRWSGDLDRLLDAVMSPPRG